ncbi:MAG TPA: methylated-DNA--[protein]-cysteine S-methyltransferase, partial [Gemmatales bacterium]|nr:methylated-DNA--[protein]-cysteine S-methyltransferase [Gemmatales bacterium]
ESSIRDHFLAAMEELDRMNTLHPEIDSVKVDCVHSPVGPLLLAVHDCHVLAVRYLDVDACLKQLLQLQQQTGKPLRVTSHRLLSQTESELQEYFAGKRKVFSAPVKTQGTAFQKKVWQALEAIPYGETWSYEDIACRIGQPEACRAVGLANGANPIAILIPCHRVIRKGGHLGGYAGGLWRKERLLQLESKVLKKSQTLHSELYLKQ